MTPKGIRNTVLSLFTVAAIAGLMGLIACQGGGGGGKTIVTVGNAKITEGDLDTLARINPRLKPRLATPAGRDKVVDNYVEQEMLYQESVNRGLNRSQDLKDKIALYEKILVAQALLDDELDKKVKEYYNNHQDEFERVKVSHILIKTASPEEKGEKPAEQPKEEKGAKGAKDKAKKPAEPTVAKRSDAEALKLAQSVRDRINKGEDFAKVAKEVSDDDRTKSTGGDLGYITIHDKRLERWGWLPLAEKAFSMKTGEVSDPIKVGDGYDIIKITEEKKQQPLEEAEAGIKFRLQADIRSQLLDDLKKKYKVEYAEKREPAPGAPGAPAPETAPTAPAPSAGEAPATSPTK